SGIRRHRVRVSGEEWREGRAHQQGDSCRRYGARRSGRLHAVPIRRGAPKVIARLARVSALGLLTLCLASSADAQRGQAQGGGRGGEAQGGGGGPRAPPLGGGGARHSP